MIKVYLINLDKDPDRLAFVSSHFQRLNIPFERISAVNGNEFPDDEYQSFMRARPRRDKDWLRGQMGCFLSHFRLWENLAQGDARFGAIFEDDVFLSDELSALLDTDEWIPDDVDIIRLDASTNRVKLGRQARLQRKKCKLYSVQSTSWCTGGYILGRRAARMLVELPVVYHQPSDVLLFNHEQSVIAPRLQVLQCYPALCAQAKQLKTRQLESGRVQFSSNIEIDEAESTREFSANYSPLRFFYLLLRFFYQGVRGYRRIPFKS